MNITITAKIKIYTDVKQSDLLKLTMTQYTNACNYVSELVFKSNNFKQAEIHKQTYAFLRLEYRLPSQMACSVIKTVLAKYKTVKSLKNELSQVKFKKLECDLVWNRDYSLLQDLFSVNTLQGRIKVPFETKGMEQYFNSDWCFGTAKLVFKHNKWFLHIPMTKIIEEMPESKINNVVGVDFGISFIATAFDSNGKTVFFSGKKIKHKRAKYKNLRKQLQQKQTPSARKRLKIIGNRENRFITDINHSVSKALISKYGANTLFVIEDLTGIRNATEKVHIKDRYISVSWSFYQLRQFMEYKALLYGSKVIAVNPAYTSQTCPKCGHTDKANRNKKQHIFNCKSCGYKSNDDRIGAMNLQRKGIEYIAEVTGKI